MMHTSTLTTRQHAREAIDYRAEFVIAPEHRDQVKFSSTSQAVNAHTSRGRATDMSPGGIGLFLPEYLPRMTEGTVRVFSHRPTGTARDGTPIYDVVLEHRVKVRRVSLAGHEPTYALGLAFVDAEPGLPDRIDRLKAAMRAAHGTDADPREEGDGHA